MTSDDLSHQVQTGWPMSGVYSRKPLRHPLSWQTPDRPDAQQPQPWQPWKFHGVKLQKHSGLDGKSVVSVGSQVPILMAIDGR